MKIFVSYSRRDAGDFAEQIDEHLRDQHDIFTDVNDIQIGSVWSNVIENNISNCDLFVAIITHAALLSPEVEKEVLRAQRENKIIIPCFHRDVSKNEIKWNLNKFQGIEFEEKYELVRKLYPKITRIQKDSGKRSGGTSSNTKVDSTDKGVSKSKDTSSSSSAIKEGKEENKREEQYYYPHTVKEEKKLQQSWISPKILIPIIIVAVVGPIIAFAVFNTTTTTPPSSETDVPPPNTPETTTITPPSSETDVPPPNTPETTTTTPPSSETANFLIYENRTAGIKIQYPSNWQINEYAYLIDPIVANIVGFHGPLSLESTNTFREYFGISIVNLPENVTLDSYYRYLSRSWNTIPGVNIIESDTITLAGNPAYRTVSTWRDEIQQLKNQIIVMVNNGKSYMLTYGANEEDYESYLSTIQKMINSFELINSNESTNAYTTNTTPTQPPETTTTTPSPETEQQQNQQQYSFITKWGSNGTGNGQFSDPEGIAIDSAGNVYVAEYYNNRIQKFSSDGTFITSWGSEGTGNGQFSSPYDVAIDSAGNVYVADSDNNRIQKFSSDGTFITAWGSEGTGNGQFSDPYGIAIDSAGNVYVSEEGNDRIQVFAPSM